MQKNTMIKITAIIYAIMILAVFAIHVLSVDLYRFGILPRKAAGLYGVFLSPFIHRDFTHLLSNSLPFFLFNFLIIVFYQRYWLKCSILITILSGAGVWLFARGNSYHVGASSLIYGLAFFIIFMGFKQRNLKALLIAFFVIFFYSSSLISGLLPISRYISWEGHLFGALAGIAVAVWFTAGKNRYTS